jgi:hypothetical protein
MDELRRDVEDAELTERAFREAGEWARCTRFVPYDEMFRKEKSDGEAKEERAAAVRE